MFQTPTTRVWKQLFDEGQLNAPQSVFWLPKPAEELFDLTEDPYQIKNLAAVPEQQLTLQRLRGALKTWMIETRDLGLLPEGEMLDRAGSGAPYDLGQDAVRFPIESIYAAADLATRPVLGDTQRLVELCVSPESGVRYWVANGLLIRALADQDRAEAIKTARGMTNDPSPFVRCVANEVLARFGTESDRAVAVKALLKEANPMHSNTFVAIAALNTLDWLELTRAELGDALTGLPARSGPLSARYDAYIPRMADRINSTAK
jgi:uncharacterized sulfatase